MLSLHTPDQNHLRTMVDAWRGRAYSYPVGLLHRDPPSRLWFTDRHSAVVGHGRDQFEFARQGLVAWAQFQQEWARPALPPATIEVGSTVGYTAQVLGVWWSYCCRIIATIDEVTGEGVTRFGFEYGTLVGHAERGEERFLIEHDPVTDDVTFSLFAVSQPGRWFTWPGLPIARRAQARFRPGAMATIRAYVADRAHTIGSVSDARSARDVSET